MMKQIINRLRPANPWHYIWIAILASEFFTFFLNSLQSYLRWGFISGALIEIGVIDALVCSAIVAPIAIYFLKSANDRLILEIAQHNLVKRNLEESEEKLRAIFDFANDVVLVADSEGNLIDANKKAEELLGYTKSELTSMHISRLHPEEELDRTISAFKEMVRNSSGILHDGVVVTKDKRRIYFDISGSVVRYANGEIALIGIFRDITERKIAEETLQRSEERFSLAFHSSPVGMVISARTDGRIIDANEAYAQVTGYQREELLGKTTVELDLWFDVADRGRLLDMLERNGKVKNVEIPIRRRNGDILIAQTSLEAIEIEKEQCLLSSVQDITERKLVEDALRESEKRFHEFMDNSPTVAWMKDGQGRYVYVNKTLEERFEIDRAHWSGKTDFDIWPPAVAERFRKNDIAALESYQTIEVVEEAIGPSGESSFWWIFKFPVLASGGRGYVGGIGIDITDRKKMEQTLQDSLATSRTLLDTPIAAAFLIDREGICVDVNETLCKRFNKERADIVGTCIWDLFSPEVSKRRRAHFDEVLRGKKQVRFEDDRQGIWYDNVVTPILDSRGEVLKAVVFSFDVTERKQIERELRNYRDHLEELVEERTKEITVLNDQLRQSQKLEAVGLLAGGVAHDFNNILATIKGSTYIIQKQLEKDSPIVKYVEQVESSVNKANDIAKSLLTFSRQQTPILEPLDLNELIRKTMRLITQVLGELIKTHLSLAPHKMVALANGDQMVRVLLNLASNAKDSMNDGGTFTIKTDMLVMDDAFIKNHGFGVPGKYVLLSLSDTGIGMDEGTKERIFEPFFTTKEIGKGSGLGLAVVYGIVKQHKGYISCDTALHQGTIFRLYLPAVEKEPVQREKNKVLSTWEGTETILLAEDDDAVRRTLSQMLRLSGYTVFEAVDGEDAVSIYSRHKDLTDLVLLDVRMPKMNGREVYEAIRKAGSKTAVLFISGYTDDILKSSGILPTDFNFISKAALPYEILRKVREVLDNKQRGN
jgi:PAS domain S-box-containing protein